MLNIYSKKKKNNIFVEKLKKIHKYIYFGTKTPIFFIFFSSNFFFFILFYPFFPLITLIILFILEEINNSVVARPLPTKLQYKGYEYVCANISDADKTYYRCSNYQKLGCEAMLEIKGHFESTILFNNHHSKCQCKTIQGVRLAKKKI